MKPTQALASWQSSGVQVHPAPALTALQPVMVGTMPWDFKTQQGNSVLATKRSSPVSAGLFLTALPSAIGSSAAAHTFSTLLPSCHWQHVPGTLQQRSSRRTRMPTLPHPQTSKPPPLRLSSCYAGRALPARSWCHSPRTVLFLHLLRDLVCSPSPLPSSMHGNRTSFSVPLLVTMLPSPHAVQWLQGQSSSLRHPCPNPRTIENKRI